MKRIEETESYRKFLFAHETEKKTYKKREKEKKENSCRGIDEKRNMAEIRRKWGKNEK